MKFTCVISSLFQQKVDLSLSDFVTTSLPDCCSRPPACAIIPVPDSENRFPCSVPMQGSTPLRLDINLCMGIPPTPPALITFRKMYLSFAPTYEILAQVLADCLSSMVLLAYSPAVCCVWWQPFFLATGALNGSFCADVARSQGSCTAQIRTRRFLNKFVDCSRKRTPLLLMYRVTSRVLHPKVTCPRHPLHSKGCCPNHNALGAMLALRHVC